MNLAKAENTSPLLDFARNKKSELVEKIEHALKAFDNSLIGAGKSFCTFHAYPTSTRLLFNSQPQPYELPGYMAGGLALAAGYGYLALANSPESLVPMLAAQISSGVFETCLFAYNVARNPEMPQ